MGYSLTALSPRSDHAVDGFSANIHAYGTIIAVCETVWQRHGEIQGDTYYFTRPATTEAPSSPDDPVHQFGWHGNDWQRLDAACCERLGALICALDDADLSELVRDYGAAWGNEHHPTLERMVRQFGRFLRDSGGVRIA